jgi:pimeloyl-ACP methyl ester carboxylesterase
MPYADVNGLHLYYEEHGGGPPLVLLHGGLMTIELNFGIALPVLAERHRVIAIELQGHGRTADVDRPPTFPDFAADVVALLDHLGIERADVVGFSLGGLTGYELAISYPDRVVNGQVLVLAGGQQKSSPLGDGCSGFGGLGCASFGAGFAHAVAVAAGDDDVGVVQETVEHRAGGGGLG